MKGVCPYVDWLYGIDAKWWNTSFMSQWPNEIPTHSMYWKTRKQSQTSSEKRPKMQFLKLQHSNSLKGLENKEKRQVFIPAACIGDPNGIRTHITTVKGWCPNH